MKRILLMLRPYGIVLGISTLIIFSSLKLAGVSDYFTKEGEAKLNFHNSDSIKLVVSPKGKKDWKIVPKIKY